MTDRNDIALRPFFQDSAILNLAMGAFIVGTLAYDAEIWVNNYPPDVKEKFGPQSKESKKRASLAALPFFLLMFGGIAWSNLKLKRRNRGQLSVSTAFANAYGLIFTGWLFDLTILDWLMFVRYTPDFVVLPGTEGMAGYDDYAFHLKEHMRALPMLAIPALILALATASRPWKKVR